MLEASSFNYELQITNYDKLKKTQNKRHAVIPL